MEKIIFADILLGPIIKISSFDTLNSQEKTTFIPNTMRMFFYFCTWQTFIVYRKFDWKYTPESAFKI